MLTLKVKKPEPMTALEELLETGGNSTPAPQPVIQQATAIYLEAERPTVAITERAVICKSCNYEFTVTSVRQHETEPERGYVTCPQCQTENNIKKVSLFPNRRRHRNTGEYYTE